MQILRPGQLRLRHLLFLQLLGQLVFPVSDIVQVGISRRNESIHRTRRIPILQQLLLPLFQTVLADDLVLRQVPIEPQQLPPVELHRPLRPVQPLVGGEEPLDIVLGDSHPIPRRPMLPQRQFLVDLLSRPWHRPASSLVGIHRKSRLRRPIEQKILEAEKNPGKNERPDRKNLPLAVFPAQKISLTLAILHFL